MGCLETYNIEASVWQSVNMVRKNVLNNATFRVHFHVPDVLPYRDEKFCYDGDEPS